MFKIAICDDNLIELKRCESFLISFFEEKNMPYLIDIFVDPGDLVLKFDEYSLIFLDIQLGDQSGINVAKKLRDLDRNVKILLMSVSRDYLIDGYKVRPLRYLTKPLDQKLFFMEINEIIEDLKAESEILIDPLNNTPILVKNIKYIESWGGKTVINCKYVSYSTNTPLGNFLDKIDERQFVLSHKGIIVNLEYVKKLEENFIVMEDGTRLLLSRRNKRKFVNSYFNYLGGKV